MTFRRGGSDSPSPRSVLVLLVFVVLLAVAACVGPSRTAADFREKAANTAESARSAVETARLAVAAAEDGRLTGPFAGRLLSQMERDVGSIATSFSAVQPPTAGSDTLRSELTRLLDECESVLGDLRIAARRGELDRLPEIARPLADLSARLQRLEQVTVT